MKLETKRLILRKPKVSDWKDLVEGLNDRTILGGINMMPHPYKKKDALKWINNAIKEWQKKELKECHFIIEIKTENKIIGAMSLKEINKRDKTSVTGSWISKRYRGKKYITEAKLAVNDFAFNKLGLLRLTSFVYKPNIASQKVQEGVGYVREGELREVHNLVYPKKLRVNSYVYGLLKRDWKKKRPEIVRKLKGLS